MSTPSYFETVFEGVRSRRRLPRPVDRKRLREDAGLSLRKVADVLTKESGQPVSHTAVASWEAGSTPREHLDAYARLLQGLARVLDEDAA